MPRPDRRLQAYEGEGFAVTFDPNTCIHSGICVRGLPTVFDVRRKRWVAVEGATAEEIEAQIARCPSGALQFVRESTMATKKSGLPQSMLTGKASPAKAADGDKPVFAYIASLPQPQRGIAERVDALAAKTLPRLQRSVKWGMSYYGVGDGWCFCCGGFADHVKLMFINGDTLVPVPPVTPAAMGKSTRGVELRSEADLDERQIAAWMKRVAAVPGVGGKKR